MGLSKHLRILGRSIQLRRKQPIYTTNTKFSRADR
jgi:hypothetical protein